MDNFLEHVENRLFTLFSVFLLLLDDVGEFDQLLAGLLHDALIDFFSGSFLVVHVVMEFREFNLFFPHKSTLETPKITTGNNYFHNLFFVSRQLSSSFTYLKTSVDFFDGFITDFGFPSDFISHKICFLFNGSCNAILTVFALLVV